MKNFCSVPGPIIYQCNIIIHVLTVNSGNRLGLQEIVIISVIILSGQHFHFAVSQPLICSENRTKCWTNTVDYWLSAWDCVTVVLVTRPRYPIGRFLRHARLGFGAYSGQHWEQPSSVINEAMSAPLGNTVWSLLLLSHPDLRIQLSQGLIWICVRFTWLYNWWHKQETKRLLKWLLKSTSRTKT